MKQDQIDELRTKMHAEAAELSRRAAGVAAAHQAQAHTKSNELAQQHCPGLLARLVALRQERHEQGAELQEARHQLAAMRQAETPNFQRGAELTFRAQWLEEQIAQKDQALTELDAQIRDHVARGASQQAHQVKAEHNKLTREKGAKQQALVEQLNALEQEYDAPLGELRRQLVALSMLTPVDLELVGVGTYRE